MADLEDIDLVREFVDRNSEDAFAELVRRHVNLVYSVALRFAGNSHDAQELTQAVFIILARKASGLRQRKTIAGWLYETTRWMGIRLLRSQARRRDREQEAYMQSTLNDSDFDAAWRQLGPILEEGMSRLGEGERALLVLRYFENKSGAETAALLGIQEWAAHKRTARALEKLRKYFTKRGIASTTAVIAGAISAHSVQSAPVALAGIATVAALGKGAAAGGSTLTLVKGALKIMAWSTAKTTAVSVVVAGMAILLVRQYQVEAGLREDNEAMRQRMTQLLKDTEEASKSRARSVRLATTQMQLDAVPTDNAKATNLLDRINTMNSKLSHEQIEAFLKTSGRDASSLLAAFRTGGDATLLKEAMAKYPNDPKVAFEAAISQNLSPEEKRQWLNNFEKTAPDNAMANYLSAFDYFKSGQNDQAMQELGVASGKQSDDYTNVRSEEDVEPYLAAGYSLAEAKTMASSQIVLPQLAEMKQDAMTAIDLAKGYTQSGDTASAQAALQMVANMGQQFDNPSAPTEITELVGMAIQKMALSAMDPNTPFGDNGQTVQDELDQLAQRKAELKSLNEQAEPLMPSLSDQDWIVYEDRRAALGEPSAMQWVIHKFGQPQP